MTQFIGNHQHLCLNYAIVWDDYIRLHRVILQIHLGDCVGHSDLSTGQFCHFIAKVLHFIASCIIP